MRLIRIPPRFSEICPSFYNLQSFVVFQILVILRYMFFEVEFRE